VVEPFRRSELDYFSAYREDYSQQREFGRRPHNPAFEVIYVYARKEGSLDLNFRGSNNPSSRCKECSQQRILKLPELPTSTT
jgi:hypothetical protein